MFEAAVTGGEGGFDDVVVVQVVAAVGAGCNFLFGDGDEAAVVEAHEAGDDVACGAGVGHFAELAVGVSVDEVDGAKKVGGDIEQESDVEDLGVAHVPVFVFVDGIKPVEVGFDVFLVTHGYFFLDAFAGVVVPEEGVGAVDGV